MGLDISNTIHIIILALLIVKLMGYKIMTTLASNRKRQYTEAVTGSPVQNNVLKMPRERVTIVSQLHKIILYIVAMKDY